MRKGKTGGMVVVRRSHRSKISRTVRMDVTSEWVVYEFGPGEGGDKGDTCTKVSRTDYTTLESRLLGRVGVCKRWSISNKTYERLIVKLLRAAPPFRGKRSEMF